MAKPTIRNPKTGQSGHKECKSCGGTGSIEKNSVKVRCDKCKGRGVKK